MDLHTSKEADWAHLDREDMNPWQRIAADTNGWVTPANVVSVVGGLLTEKGLLEVKRGNYDNGALYLASGRICDLIDGWLADKTGTKSPTGEAVDAGIDKLLILSAFALLWSEEVVPRPVLVSFAAQNGANAMITGIAKQRGRDIHPTKSGKFTAFGQWATIGMGVIEKSLDSPNQEGLRTVARYATRGLAAISNVLGADATKGYLKDAVGKETPLSR